MSVAKVGRRGQITLPKDIRRQLNIREGDRIGFLQRGEEIVLQPLSQTLFELRGSVPVSGPQDFTSIRKQVRETRARRSASDDA